MSLSLATSDWPSAINSDWRQWLVGNLQRGCNEADLVATMVNKGNFSLEVAMRGVAAARAQGSKPLVVELPDVNTRLRRIDLGDCAVTVRAELERPRVVVLDGVLTPAECAELVAYGEADCEKARVIDPKTGERVDSDGRRSRLAGLSKPHPVVQALEQRLSKLAGWPLAKFETLQAINYGPSDEYRPHYDFFRTDQPTAVSRLHDAGQRVGTFVTYIQEPEEGGATSFPNAGNLKVHPTLGTTLWFRNLKEDGSPDTDTLHAGDPVVQGAKWVVSAWLRVNNWRGS